MVAVNIISGMLLLFFGRRLFWLFVAAVGFVVGTTLALEWFGDESATVFTIVALTMGIVGALASLFLRGLAVGVAGFFAGGYVAHVLVAGSGIVAADWVVFLIGGVLGAVLLMIVFDWALIAISAMTGAAMMIQHVDLPGGASGLVFLALVISGVLVQARQLYRTAAQPRGVSAQK